MKSAILVINADSSSIRSAVWPADDTNGEATLQGQISRIGHLPHFKPQDGASQTVATLRARLIHTRKN